MRNATRQLYNTLLSTVAQANGVASASEQFTVDPTVEQRIETKMTESVAFLSRINLVGVDQLMGAKVGMSVTSTIAARTAPENLPRKPRFVGGLDEQGYVLHDTEFDTFIPWALIDQWAKFPDFADRYMAAVLTAIGQDRIRIGFNGRVAARQTDRQANPNLEDVNIGWLEKLRLERPDHVMGRQADPANNVAAEPVTVGQDGTYANIDALAFDLVSGMPSWARGDTEIVAIVGQGLVDDKYFPMINQALLPTEQLARDVIMATKQIGGKPAVIAPFFPEKALLLTPLKNLSLYYQDGARRRFLKDEPENKRVADYQSSNEAYVIEDTDYAVLADNVEIAPAN